MSEATRPATTACTRAESGSIGPIQIPPDSYYGTHAAPSLISLPGRLIVFTIALAALFGLTGCLVQSVYPWYGDEDVVFDGNLAGAWIGEGPMKGCLLNITADPTRRVRHYNIEVSKVPGGCQDLNSESAKLSGGGQMVQSGQQRFFDVWDDRCDLHTLLKINTDSQTLSLVPMDPDSMANLIRQKVINGRIEGHTMWPDDVLLTSSSSDLRQFLRRHADDKELFSEEDTMKFHRK
jgi:hypothetical protein